MTRPVHKVILWMTLDGRAEFRLLCNPRLNKNKLKYAITAKEVTCKNCLRDMKNLNELKQIMGETK